MYKDCDDELGLGYTYGCNEHILMILLLAASLFGRIGVW